MGPKRDIVGEWKRAALKRGLRFGVSEHLGASYTWFGSSHGADASGPMAGVPYDGADSRNAELYHPVHDEPLTGPYPKWNWYAKNAAWHAEWLKRIGDLLDRYQPDLLYTDGGIPFGNVGRGLVAKFYNDNAAQHGGVVQAVYTHKNIGSGEFIREAAVQDVERGGMPDINALPWQTDTSVGDWFYSEGYKYKTTQQVVQMLADVVSKNGNLLLNVVLYADGSLPPEPKMFLAEMAQWIRVNGEAIYSTRPWRKFGEGPTQAESGHFKEDVAYTARDIRFTTKGDVLYAITLGVPRGKVKIAALGKSSAVETRPVKNVTLLGSAEALTWSQEADALVINVPANLPTDFASAFKITF